MSDIKYGLISRVDANVLEKTIDLICKEFPDETLISVCEVGVYGGQTSQGIYEYIESKGRMSFNIGVDNNKDGEEVRFFYNNLLKGNSSEVYNKIKDDDMHLIFIDGLHTFAGVISDFFCYAPKVKIGGYLAFHDTGKHLDPLSGWQGVGDKNDPDMCLGGVRKALDKIGLLNNKLPEWKIIFDEAQIDDEGGGICIFKKISHWD